MTPLFMKDAVITIDAADYQAECSSAALTPSTSSTTWKGLTPTAVFTEAGAATWVVDLTYAQDFNDPLSLGVFLFNHEGESVDMAFEPKAGGAGFTATVVIVPGAAGGTVDAFAESTVSLPVQGRPVLVPGVLAADESADVLDGRAARRGKVTDNVDA